MRLLGGHVTDDIHMDSLRLRVPDVETNGKRGCFGTDALGDSHGVGAALFHRLRQL